MVRGLIRDRGPTFELLNIAWYKTWHWQWANTKRYKHSLCHSDTDCNFVYHFLKYSISLSNLSISHKLCRLRHALRHFPHAICDFVTQLVKFVTRICQLLTQLFIPSTVIFLHSIPCYSLSFRMCLHDITSNALSFHHAIFHSVTARLALRQLPQNSMKSSFSEHFSLIVNRLWVLRSKMTRFPS